MVISLSSLLFVWIVAFPVGIYSAVRQYSVGDYAATFLSYIGLATPNFLLALILMYVAFRYLGLDIGGLFSVEYREAPWSLAKVLDLLEHLWVPTVVLGTAGTAGLVRIMRANLLDELRKQYVITARAKGLAETTLIMKYPVRVALNPFISTVGWTLPTLISGGGLMLDQCPPLPANFAPTRDEPRWIASFRDGTLGDESSLELGLNRRFGRSSQTWTDAEWRLYRGAYRWFMGDVDRQIGIVLDALRDSGLERDTVVIFTSDHGDHDSEHRLTMKRSFYEAAVHVPLIVRWPGQVPAGRADETHLVNNCIDILPTLCDLAGVAAPAGLPGRSFARLALGGEPAPWRDYVVSETVAGRMLRSATEVDGAEQCGRPVLYPT